LVTLLAVVLFVATPACAAGGAGVPLLVVGSPVAVPPVFVHATAPLWYPMHPSGGIAPGQIWFPFTVAHEPAPLPVVCAHAVTFPEVWQFEEFVLGAVVVGVDDPGGSNAPVLLTVQSHVVAAPIEAHTSPVTVAKHPFGLIVGPLLVGNPSANAVPLEPAQYAVLLAYPGYWLVAVPYALYCVR
jgi:hypothetical protein